MSDSSRSLRIGLGAAAALLAMSAGATEFEYGVTAGVGTSDNITRVPANEIEETIAMAGLDLRLVRESSRVDADVDIDLTYYDYQENTYENDVSGMANAGVRFKLVPDRFAWVFLDSFGQLSLDPFEAQTPETLENINYFTTGPDLMTRLGSWGRLTVIGRYSLTDYEESNFDDERLAGGLSVARDLSENSNLSVNATAERVEFDDPAFGSNFDRQSAFFRYELENARTRLGAQAGYTRSHDFNGTIGSPLFELDVSRNVSERSIVFLRGGVRSSDAASELREGNITGGGIGSSPQQPSSADLFETRHATLGWQFSAQRTDFQLSAGYAKDVYELENGLDHDRTFLRALIERQLTARLSVRAEGSLQSFDYEATGYTNDDTRFSLLLSWNITGRIYVELDFESLDSNSSNPLTEYDEQRAFIRLAWRDRSATAPPVAR